MSSTLWYWNNKKKASKAVLKRRKFRLAKGYCAICPNKREDLTKRNCESCRAKATAYQKKLRVNKILLGECLEPGCLNEAETNKSRCRPCLDKKMERWRQLHAGPYQECK
jgi:hypothetical protein